MVYACIHSTDVLEVLAADASLETRMMDQVRPGDVVLRRRGLYVLTSARITVRG